VFFAIAGMALTAIIATISAAAARTKIMRLNVPPPLSSVATVIVVVSLGPIIFFLLFSVEGAGCKDSSLPPPVYCL
jgi:Co/Zn/Cd efflux system component